MNTIRLLPVLVASCLFAGCAGGIATIDRAPANVHPGFDTWQYPGEAALEAWEEASPYQWVGYYLPAPCRRDSSWIGKRAAIQNLGWGTAVIYVGQQLFEGEPATNDLPPERIICSQTLLTPEQGRRDAQDAVTGATREGFPPGTTIFLNVERVSALSDSLINYYQAWTGEVLRDGRYRPGTYAHNINAAGLFTLAQEAYREAGRAGAPPFWVAGGSGFALDRPPEAVGLPFATVWQGALDVQRTYGGVTLEIDENTARHPSPSTEP